MRYGALRTPNFRASDIENVETFEDLRSNRILERKSSNGSPFSILDAQKLGVSKANIIFGTFSFSVIATFLFVICSFDYQKAINNFKPMYIMEEAEGMAYLYSFEINKSPIFSGMSPEQIGLLYKGYVQKFGKKFMNETEELLHYEIFDSMLKLIDKNNKDNINHGGESTHGLNKFTDFPPGTFRNYFLKAHPKSTSLEFRLAEVVNPVSSGAVDWSGKLTTPVTDQGLCGACWAFSAVNQVESDSIRLNLLKTTDKLSVDQLISCAENNLGCRGGWTEEGFKYIKDHGISLYTDYPYSEFWHPEEASACYADRTFSMVKVTDVYSLQSEEDMVSHVLSTGPISVCIDASNWQTYIGGVLASCGKEPNHCVQVVGVNTDEGYWKIRNNWGSDWGENGYIRIALGSNMCGITYDPHFVDVEAVKHDTILVKDLYINITGSKFSFDEIDPYVVFSLGSQSYTTNVIKDTLNPAWPDRFTVNWDDLSDLEVTLYDSNWFYPDDKLATLKISLLSFPAHTFVKLNQKFDDNNADISFTIMLRPLDNLNKKKSLKE